MLIEYVESIDDFVCTNLGFKLSQADLRKICFYGDRLTCINGINFYAVNTNNALQAEIRIRLSRKNSCLVAIRDNANCEFTMFEKSKLLNAVIVN